MLGATCTSCGTLESSCRRSCTGEGTRESAVDAVHRLPDLAAVALGHVVDYLRSFASEGVLQQVM